MGKTTDKVIGLLIALSFTVLVLFLLAYVAVYVLAIFGVTVTLWEAFVISMFFRILLAPQVRQ